MLPTKLKEVRDQLANRKRTGVISKDEEELLKELETLDAEPVMKRLSESEGIWKRGVISGPSDRCACCGRK